MIIIFVISLIYPVFAQQSSCDYKAEILVDGDEFESEEFKWRMRAVKIEGKSTNITGTAEIEDSNGKTAKSYKPWTSASISKQKTSSEYSPNLKPGNYKITAEISVECDDSNKDNNVDVKTMKIKGEKKEEVIKKSSKNTNLDTKSTEIVEEAKTSNQNEAQVQTNQNTKAITTKTKKQAVNEETENIVQLTNRNQQKLNTISTQAIQNPETVYVSNTEKVKNLILIFLLTLSILLNIILIWKR